MHCSRCGRDIEPESLYCRFCGASVSASTPLPPAARRLVRRPDDGRLGGVCAGMAEYFNTDVTFMRLVWVVLALVPGGVLGGVLAYLAAWIVIPAAPGPLSVEPGARRLVRSRTERQIAGVCGGLAAYFNVDPTLMRVVWTVLSIMPGAIVLGVVAYVMAVIIMPEESHALPASSTA
jgi:phage shock protein PspC (stress-responsive transcriptional regulator)